MDNEDCLYLNVYAPPGHHGRLPVLVMIHGGGLTTGAGGQLISLRPGDQTRTIAAGTFAAGHQCSFWNG